jgi:SAM-dependent methyltransferase
MSAASETFAYWLLIALQATPFRGNCNAFAKTDNLSSSANVASFPQADLEAANYAEFAGFFKLGLPDMAGLTVLDLGSGYGGKTVALAEALHPERVVGVEPYANVIERSNGYAQFRGSRNCEFRQCGHLDIPAADNEFDVLVSHDVIEHVADPKATIAEMRRVLKPNGKAYIVFTPYWGALSHHLGYVSRLPFIHWLFSPNTLVKAINRILTGANGPRYGVVPQPAPKKSYDGKFDCLPTLNGISGPDFLTLAKQQGFEVEYLNYPTIAERFAPNRTILARVNRGLMRLHPVLTDGLSFNLTCILRRTDDTHAR